MKYRRNMSDAELRALERTWRADKANETALEAYNAARIRVSLPPIGVPAFRLEWGYQAGIPDVETTAWGCRAILTDRGVDIVYGSSHGTPEAVQGLREVLDAGLLRDAITEVRRLLRTYRMRGDEAEEFVLGQVGNVIVLGNTNASHGYLYMTAFEIPELGADGLPYEVPALACEICKKNQVYFDGEMCGKCHLRICDDCSGMNDCDTCDVVTCSHCKSNLTCSATGCNNFICNTPACLEDSPKCEMCPGGADEANLLCASCGEENKMCSYCSEAECSVCREALFTEDGSNRTKACENCDELMHYACRKQPCKCEVSEEDDEEDGEEEEEDTANRANPYHRSVKSFDTFSDAKARFGDYGPGLYFSDEDSDTIRHYGSNLYQVTLDLKSPLNVEEDNPALVKKLERLMRLEEAILPDEPMPPLVQLMGMAQSMWHNAEDPLYRPERVIKILKGLGYDGIIVPSKGFSVVFDPSQVTVVSKTRSNPDDMELGGWAVVHDSGDLIADGFNSQGEAQEWLQQTIIEGLLDDVSESYHVTLVED